MSLVQLARVGLAGKGAALSGGLGRPRARERGGREGTEVAAVGADGLDQHEVLVLALEGVDLDGLEEVVGRGAHDDGRGAAKAAGEVADGHAGAVDLAVVSGEEEVHVLTVTNEGLVDRAGARARNGAREEGLRGAPAVGVGRVARRLVGEGTGTSPLVGEDPDALGGKVEECRRHGGGRLGVLRSRAHAGPAAKGAKSHGPPFAAVVIGRVDEVLAVVVDVGEVLERLPAALGLGESARVRPLVRRGKLALGRDRGR